MGSNKIYREIKTWNDGRSIYMDTKESNAFTNTVNQYTRMCVDTEEKAIRAELIRMGWTPPKELQK